MFRGCFADFNRVCSHMGERWAPLAGYALHLAHAPGLKSALRSLMPRFAMPAIPPADLKRVAVSTTLVWGRHDLQVRLNTAEAASARYGWPLHIIENARDDPAFEQPEAFLKALHAALDRPRRRVNG
jgi:pimeloyl-ACP methyl ester carboxylesterase